jgi:hypothetical protein
MLAQFVRNLLKSRLQMSNSCIYIKAITKATSTLPYSVIGEAVLDFREIARKENDEENDTKGIANSPLRQHTNMSPQQFYRRSLIKIVKWKRSHVIEFSEKNLQPISSHIPLSKCASPIETHFLDIRRVRTILFCLLCRTL